MLYARIATASEVATALTVHGIETMQCTASPMCQFPSGCNSPYRLRYALKGARRQRSKATMKSAHLKYLSEARVKQR